MESLNKEKLYTNPNKLVNEIIQQMFGYINRRENVSQLVNQIKELNLLDEVSSRFFISLVL